MRKEDLPNYMRVQLIARGITATAAAAEMGMSRSNFSNIMNQRVTPSAKFLAYFGLKEVVSYEQKSEDEPIATKRVRRPMYQQPRLPETRQYSE